MTTRSITAGRSTGAGAAYVGAAVAGATQRAGGERWRQEGPEAHAGRTPVTTDAR